VGIRRRQGGARRDGGRGARPGGHGRAVLKVYLATLVSADSPQPLEHAELRWLGHDELNSVEWLPADAPIVAALRPVLAAGVEQWR
jgi:8-oxo-dGTP diphosphatase